MKEVSSKYHQLEDTVQKLHQRESEISEKLDEIEEKTRYQGNTMTDTSAVGKVKHAIHQLKQEILGLEIRSGVVSNSLLHAKMREKTNEKKGKGNTKSQDDNFIIA